MSKKLNFVIKPLLAILLMIVSSSMLMMNVLADPSDYTFTIEDTLPTGGINIPYSGIISASETNPTIRNIANYTNNELTLTLESTAVEVLNNAKIKLDIIDSESNNRNDDFQAWFVFDDGTKIDWLNALVDGKYLGEQVGYQLNSGTPIVIDFYLLAKDLGDYAMVLSLIEGTTDTVVTTQAYNFNVIESHSFNDIGIDEFAYTGLYSGTPTNVTDLPQYVQDHGIGINLSNIYFANIPDGIIKIDVISGDQNNMNLWAKDTSDHWFDLSKIGYWGPSTGFPITPSYNVTTPIYVMFNKMGSYQVKLSLVDANDNDKIYTAKTYNFTIGPDVRDDSLDQNALNDIIGDTDYESINIYNFNTSMPIYKELFGLLKNGGKTISFVSLDNDDNFIYKWTFDGTQMGNLLNLDDIDIHFTISNTTTDPLLSGKNPLILTFDHEGKLPGKTEITIKVDPSYMTADDLWLYYYDEATDQYKFVGVPITKNVVDNTITFSIDHCSTYIMTTGLIPEAIGNPSTGDINVALFIFLGLFSLTGMTYTIRKTILAK